VEWKYEINRLIRIKTLSIDYENVSGIYEVELENWQEGGISEELKTILDRLEYQRGPVILSQPTLIDMGAYWYPNPIWRRVTYVSAPITPYYVTSAIEQELGMEIQAKFYDIWRNVAQFPEEVHLILRLDINIAMPTNIAQAISRSQAQMQVKFSDILRELGG